MNINGMPSSNNSPLSNAFKSITHATTTPASNETESNVSPAKAVDTVSISREALAAVSADISATLRAKNDEKAQEAEAVSIEEKTPIDAQMDRIKEQIKALQEMLGKLSGDTSEAAEQQRKLIQEQILQLNNQLAVLTDQKLRDAKQNT